MNLNDNATAGQLYTVLNRLTMHVQGSSIRYEDYFGVTPKQSTISREQAVKVIYTVLEKVHMVN